MAGICLTLGKRREIERLYKNDMRPSEIAAADLELFPEGSEKYRRAEDAAMNTSRTVFELYGATAAEDLRAAGLQERSRVSERMSQRRPETNFEKITASPEAFAAFLGPLPTLSGPWDDSFHREFCDGCPAENCDAENCPYNAERGNPLWWLGLAAEADT